MCIKVDLSEKDENTSFIDVQTMHSLIGGGAGIYEVF